jgi:hypothetical protein
MRFIFVSLGLGVLIAALWMRHMNRKAASWPGTVGKIIDSRLERDAHDAGNTVLITYAYTVDERSFQSSCVSFTPKSDHLHTKEEVVARYPVDQSVTVYFDPANPQRSVLERKQSAKWLVLAVAGAVSMAIGLLAP